MTQGSASNNTEYAGNYMYQDGTLQFFNHPEGYVMMVAGTSGETKGFSGGQTTYSQFEYAFQFRTERKEKARCAFLANGPAGANGKGNIRLTYSDADLNGSISQSEIIEESNYYPFGLKQHGYNNAQTGGNDLAQQWKFGSKEFQDDAIGGTNLNWYDFGARNYDAALGKWMNIDPLAEEMRRHSPYNYAFDNPIYFVDPDGLMPCDFDDPNCSENGGMQDPSQPNMPAEMAYATSGSGTSTTSNASSDNLIAYLDNPGVQSGYPGQVLDELVTSAIQYVASELTRDDVSRGTAENIQLGADIIIFFSSKFKNTNAVKRIVNSSDEGIEFTADLTKTKSTTRSSHRNAANKQLNEAMQNGPDLRQRMETKDPNVMENTSLSVKPGNKTATRKNPKGYEWDHNTNNKYDLDLRSKKNHSNKTAKDPGRRGGYSKYWENKQ